MNPSATPRSDMDALHPLHRKTAIDQRLARMAARPLARTRVSPNMLSFAGMAIGLCAAGLFAQGEPALDRWAGALFVLAVWMDHLDGEHARAAGKSTRLGHYVDHVAAMTSYVSMFVGVGFGARGALGGWAVALGIVAGVAVIAIFSLRMWIEARRGPAAVAMTARAGFEIEDTLYLVAPIAWIGALEPFLVAAGIGAPLFLSWVVRDAVRTARRPTAAQ